MQKDRRTKRQKDRKAERQRGREAERPLFTDSRMYCNLVVHMASWNSWLSFLSRRAGGILRSFSFNEVLGQPKIGIVGGFRQCQKSQNQTNKKNYAKMKCPEQIKMQNKPSFCLRWSRQNPKSCWDDPNKIPKNWAGQNTKFHEFQTPRILLNMVNHSTPSHFQKELEP